MLFINVDLKSMKNLKMSNRTLKFRAWDTLAKRFTYPDQGYQGHYGLDLNGRFQNLQNGSGGDEYIVQQFTGLKDSTGVEVWEGDILVEKHDGGEEEAYIGVVAFVAGAFMLDGDTLYNYVFSHSPDILEDFTVEGNVFENSELLK